ncbi:hypothetical protein RhiirC2_862418 [Rhizophagus irregularis]|uniref:BTB domain-containing protein n=1 Tax=Rhizophagus irregularis TaxID=588596 RepID=A0A2N1NS67_9GLOM|nr:hypothetical protein RhiirC2_862418 [Rhizophagus irregularis]
MSTQFLPYLSRDLTKLIENKKNYDFIINVDDENNKKEFCVHSIILEARSSYFRNSLLNGFTKKENNIYILDLPDISVNVFNIVIRYIYGGTIDLDRKEALDILNLLVVCENFKLKELYDYIQDYLIKHHQDWIFQNFVLTQQVSFTYSEFTKLQDYWTAIVVEQPEILFNATDFTSVDKDALLSLYKNGDICVKESELWDHIICWGKAQNTKLLGEISDWTTNEFNILKRIIEDFIPHIWFYEISSEDFCYKIMPYCGVLSNELYQDLSKYHLVPNWQPIFNNLTPRKKDLSASNSPIITNVVKKPNIINLSNPPPPNSPKSPNTFNSSITSNTLNSPNSPNTLNSPSSPNSPSSNSPSSPNSYSSQSSNKFSNSFNVYSVNHLSNSPIESKLINSEQAALISSWIQGNNDTEISNKWKVYGFKLLIRGSRDGFTSASFHKMCDNKGPTITIIKFLV